MKNGRLTGTLCAIFLLSACYQQEPSPQRKLEQNLETAPSIALPNPIQVEEAFDDGWRRVRLGREGLLVNLPSEPTECTIVGDVSSDSTMRCYQAVQMSPEPLLVTVWNNSFDSGIFSAEAIHSYFEGRLEGLATDPAQQTIEDVRYSKFLGFPSQTLSLLDTVEGVQTVSHKLSFAMDGAIFVITVAGEANNSVLHKNRDRVLNSISIAGLDFVPGEIFTDAQNGVTMTAPRDWMKSAPEHPFELQRFSNLTRMIVLKASGQPGFGCLDYKQAVKQTAPVHAANDKSLGAAADVFFLTREWVPDHEVTLLITHYCWNAPSGAVVLSGISEEATAKRWSSIFEASSRTVAFAE